MKKNRHSKVNNMHVTRLGEYPDEKGGYHGCPAQKAVVA